MHMLRKMALCLLVLPLTLNGLWMICQDVPPPTLAPNSAQSDSYSADQQKTECERLCARQSSLCLTSTGDKTSVTIVVYGVAIFPGQVRVGLPRMAHQAIAEILDTHSNPNIARPSPPPRT